MRRVITRAIVLTLVATLALLAGGCRKPARDR